MLSSFLLSLIYLTLLILGLISFAFFLWIGSRLFGIPGINFRRCLVAVVAMNLIELATMPVFCVVENSVFLNDATMEVFSWIGNLFISGLFLKWMFHTTWLKVILVLSSSLILSVGSIFPLAWIVKTNLIEAYVASTNSMAPTILGVHQTTSCPECGRLAIVEYFRRRPAKQPRHRNGICPYCFQTAVFEKVDPEVHEGDRILVNKLFEPRRWDLVLFPSPKDPSVHFVHRLVGLPGETIFIESGAVFIDGKKMELPSNIRGLEFTTKLAGGAQIDWGTPNHPVHLGDDEYFVLGDFSIRSSDSRLWGPVSGSSIIGVATHIYWPLPRWRVLR